MDHCLPMRWRNPFYLLERFYFSPWKVYLDFFIFIVLLSLLTYFVRSKAEASSLQLVMLWVVITHCFRFFKGYQWLEFFPVIEELSSIFQRFLCENVSLIYPRLRSSLLVYTSLGQSGSFISTCIINMNHFKIIYHLLFRLVLEVHINK